MRVVNGAGARLGVAISPWRRCWIDRDGGRFVHRRSQGALEWLAVLSSKSIPYSVFRGGDGWNIMVDGEHFERAEREIREYEEERPRFERRLRQVEDSIIVGGFRPAALVSLGLVLFFLYTGASDSGNMFFSRGVFSSRAVADGEWWRTITALTLHADISHALGNAVFLTIFAGGLASVAGNGVAWALVLTAGIAANYAAVPIYGEWNHTSLGASTAVFAALGLLGTWRFLGKIAGGSPGKSALVVVMAVGILGLTGGAEGSDVLAHLLGFAAGAALGVMAHYGRLVKLADKPPAQTLAGLAAASLVIAAWMAAAS